MHALWTSIVSIMNYTVLPKDVALSQYSTYICNSQVEIISFLNANTLQIVESKSTQCAGTCFGGQDFATPHLYNTSYIFFMDLWLTVNNVPNT